MENISKKQFAAGTFWKVVEQFSAKGVSFIVSLIIMRKLGAEEYGLIGLTAIFTNFSDMLIDAGFTTALIRKEKVDEYDYSSVLLMSMLIAAVLYTGIFIGSPYFAAYYSKPELKSVLRVICLMLFIQAFSSTRNANIARNMQFKFLFRCNLTASIISGIIGIVLAYSGFGVWALVVQQLAQTGISTILLFLRIRWDFKFKIDFQRIKSLAAFGLGVVGSSFINYLASSVSSLIIGKRFSVTELGYSDKGGQFPMQLPERFGTSKADFEESNTHDGFPDNAVDGRDGGHIQRDHTPSSERAVAADRENYAVQLSVLSGNAVYAH